MPISSLPVMCRSTITNQHPQTQSRHNQTLHTRCWSMSNFITKAKRRMLLICSSSRCLLRDSLANVQLVQHVVLLIGQALLDASCDYTIKPTHAGLDNSGLYAAGPAGSGVCMLAIKTGHVKCNCTHAHLRLSKTHASLAVHAPMETLRLLRKALYT